MPTFFRVTVIAFVCVSVLSVIFAMIKSKKFFRCLFSSAIQGITALFAVNVIGALTGVTVAVNGYTLCASSLFGVPAVISALILDTIFAIK